MKKLIKKFWWIPVILLSLGSLAFGTISTVNNFQLKEEIAVVQQANEENRTDLVVFHFAVTDESLNHRMVITPLVWELGSMQADRLSGNY